MIIDSSSKIRALVVDDEPFARERVRRLLGAETDVEVVGECGDGFCAVDQIKNLRPDLLFLDVQMPGRDGFGVLEELTLEETPLVVFLTAFDQYAVRAFEAAALDYLLKPFDEERFAKTVARARRALRQIKQPLDQSILSPAEAFGTEPAQTSAASNAAPSYLERIVIKADGRVLFRRTAEIEWIEADGNYVRLHTNNKTYLLRETLASFESKLDPAKFVRVHRSAIVQIARIREARKTLSGSYKLVLQNGKILTMSRRFARRLPRSLSEKMES